MSIFRQLWDTQNAAPGVVASSPHCTDNGSTINGYPIACPRAEGLEAQGTNAILEQRMRQYAVLALVNRLDLAHQGWRNCGEHRIIYGKRGTGRAKNLIIFEAVLPNPKPGCREGCLPVAQFWKSLSAINNGLTRAQMLEKFYYNGLPGFRPVVHVDHYSATGVSGGYGSSGSGQIRTNQFLQRPWTLKEFKTVIDCGGGPCAFNLVPIMVKVNLSIAAAGVAGGMRQSGGNGNGRGTKRGANSRSFAISRRRCSCVVRNARRASTLCASDAVLIYVVEIVVVFFEVCASISVPARTNSATRDTAIHRGLFMVILLDEE